MITLHLEATSLAELKQMALVALDLGRVPTTDEVTAAKESIKRPVGRPRKVQPDPVQGFDQAHPDKGDFGFVEPDPVPEIDIGGMPSPDQHDDYREPNGADPETADGSFTPVTVANGGLADALALEKLKQETVAKLPDMFAAGKVNLMRAVLTKYGKGAKSFPEIEAKDFPEIAAALARGDGS
jgi:hypothetical protein